MKAVFDVILVDKKIEDVIASIRLVAENPNQAIQKAQTAFAGMEGMLQEDGEYAMCVVALAPLPSESKVIVPTMSMPKLNV